MSRERSFWLVVTGHYEFWQRTSLGSEDQESPNDRFGIGSQNSIAAGMGMAVWPNSFD